MPHPPPVAAAGADEGERLRTPGAHATPALDAVIGVLIVATFAVDIATPLGLAIWVFYAAPCTLAMFGGRATKPAYVGAASVLATILGFFFSPPAGSNVLYAQLSRGFGSLTFLALGYAGFKFVSSKLAVAHDAWVRRGQGRVAVAVAGELSVEELGGRLAGALASYVDARAVAVYAVGEARDLRLVGGFAVPASAPARVTPGDGLLGQAAESRELLVVDDAPAGYLAVGSGLGGSRASTLALLPAVVDGETQAVVELAFFRALSPVTRELLSGLAEPVGIAVRSVVHRARLKQLLEETQQQAEELAAQQEELRVSNEELSEQSRVLTEAQASLEVQQTELEQTNESLSQERKLLEQKNDRLLEAEAAMRAKAEELERVNRYKSEFLANMSHELRTPLNSSLILAKLLADNAEGNLTSEQVRFAETIYAAGNDLLTLINDILDLSKIESGKVDVLSGTVRVLQLRDQLSRLFEPLAAQKGVGFEILIEQDAPEAFDTDSQKLLQILKNLLSNALKFTEKGKVALRVSASPDGGVAFAASDTGIGIAEAQREIIFEAFRQADGTTNRKYGGTGLGLSISRDLARLLGGDVVVASEVGRGSTFTLTLPRAYDPSRRDSAVRLTGETPARVAHRVPPREASRETAREPRRDTARDAPRHPSPGSREARSEGGPPGARRDAFSGASEAFRKASDAKSSTLVPPLVDDDRERLHAGDKRVLVVEDDVAFARILVDVGHDLGFKVVVAHTAEQGFLLADLYAPSAILLDVNLPDHSGLAVLDRLKRSAKTRHVPVHVLSAHDYTRDALTMGAVGYMQKPVARDDLVEAFRRVEDRLATGVRRVLVVEDDRTMRQSIGALLNGKSVTCVEAESIAEALAKLREETFDCVVTDLSFPQGSGFELLETMANDEAYSFPPVIVYTGRNLSADEEQRIRRFSSSIIVKGARSPERLLDEVTLFLHQVESELPVEQQRLLKKARSREAAFEGKRILVVEDDVRNIFAITSVLEPKGAKIDIARNGREAIAALEKAQRDGSSPIDLVLMDIMMPEMNGFEATREIRKRREWQKLPIIALTAKAMPDDQAKCLEAGANDYASKPLDVDLLLSLLRVWMPAGVNA